MSSLGRVVGLFRAGTNGLRHGPQKTITRKAGGAPAYRQYPHISMKAKIYGEILTGGMWFWILWHCWHSPDAVLGHFEWPDASKWTNEELGIPADDEE